MISITLVICRGIRGAGIVYGGSGYGSYCGYCDAGDTAVWVPRVLRIPIIQVQHRLKLPFLPLEIAVITERQLSSCLLSL